MKRALIIVFISLLTEALPTVVLPTAGVARADVRVDSDSVVVTDPMAGAGNNKDFEIQREAYSRGVEQVKHGEFASGFSNLFIAAIPILIIIAFLKR